MQDKICPKCPNCGQNALKIIPPPKGSTSFCLGAIDESNPENPQFILGAGLPVSLMGCTSCGTIILGNEKLIGR